MSLESLCRLADLAAECQEPREVCAAALDAVLRVMGADRAAILMLDDARVMRYRAWHRLSAEYRGATDGYSPWAHDALDTSPLVAPDVQADASLGGVAHAMKAEGIHALALVPLRQRERLIGQLAIYHDTPHAFSDDEVCAARVIARQVAFGLERARVESTMSAEQAWGEFLSILGHELRNPLNAIVNAARVLETPGAREELRTLAHTILDRQVTHIARLLDDLLDESRISRGLVELQLEPFDLRGAANLAAEELSYGIAAKKHDLTLSLPAQPVTVVGDPARIRQVISNLLDNAIKFTPAQGSIALGLTVDAHGAILRIRDSGAGIAAERLTAIFQPFVHATPNAARSGGLGLGLSLVKRIVDLHGGSVRAESGGVGAGTEMIVRLPFAPPPRPPATAAPSA